MKTAPAGVVAICCEPVNRKYESYRLRAHTLSQCLQLPLLSMYPKDMPASQYVLCVNEQGVYLTRTGHHKAAPIRVSFTCGAAAHRRHYGGGKNQLIAKAVGLKSKKISRYQPLTIIDLTAGLGQDGFVLATLGCYVTLVERCSSVYQLLSDGFYRALQFAKDLRTVRDMELSNILMRMNLVEASGADYLETITRQPDIIYLDPMFPRHNKSAQVNKNMQALQAITGNDSDAGELLSMALKKARFRVVVKRPRKAPALHQQYPQLALPKRDLVMTGTAIRYDVYIQSNPNRNKHVRQDIGA